MIGITIGNINQAIDFAVKLGLVPAPIGLGAEEAITVVDKVVSGLHAAGLITDEEKANADLDQLAKDLIAPEQEAQDAIDGKD